MIFAAHAEVDVGERKQSFHYSRVLILRKPAKHFPCATEHHTPQLRRRFEIVEHSVRTLRKDLKAMAWRKRHHRENSIDKLIRHRLVKQIGHRIYEDAPRLFPAQRLIEAFGVTLHVGKLALLAVSPRKNALCIAMFAALRDLGAAGHRVPGRVGPLDLRFIAHGFYLAALVATTPKS